MIPWLLSIASLLVSGLIIPLLLKGISARMDSNEQAAREAADEAKERAREAAEEAKHLAEARRHETLLQLQMTMAAAKMSYAGAQAIKNGKTNGELRDAEKDYRAAKKAYTDFLNEQAIEHLEAKKGA